MTNKPNNQSAQEVENLAKDILASFNNYALTHEEIVQAMVEMYSQALQSKAVGYSLELLMLVFNYGKKYEKTQDLKYSMENAIKDFQSLTPTPIQTKGREVEFAEWMNEVAVRLSNGHWQYGKDINNNRFSTQNLLEIFLTNNPSNKGA